jgi:hypothetical protein
MDDLEQMMPHILVNWKRNRLILSELRKNLKRPEAI